MAYNWREDYARYQRVLTRIVELYKTRQDLKMFTELILSIVTITVFVAFAIRPTAVTIIELRRGIDAKKETITKLDSKIANLGEADNLLNLHREELSLLKTTLPDSPSPDSYVRQIEGLAKLSGVSIIKTEIAEVDLLGQAAPTGVEEEQIPINADAGNFTVSITISSPSYVSTKQFLTSMENLRRPIHIDSVSINTTEGNEGGQLLILAFNGRVPFANNIPNE